MDPFGWLSRFADWWRRTVWDFPRRETPWIRDVVFMYIRAWENAVRSYEPDLIAMRAHALTFRTLLSVIPLLAVAFSLFKAFGGLEASQRILQQKLLENLAPGTAAPVQDYTGTFVTRVSAGAIGGVGVVVLFLTVVSLLTYIEKSFNALWNVEKVRPFFHRFVIYWTLVNMNVDFEDRLRAEELEDVVDAIEANIRKAVPAADKIFIEAEDVKLTPSRRT